MATKKEILKVEIELIHEKATQMKLELKNMGLDDMIEEQERIVISALVSAEFWRRGV